MRPTSRIETALWRRLQEWIDAETNQWGGPNQTSIADALGLSTSAISEWKYGDTVPSMNNLQALAVLTKIPLSELVELIEPTVAARRVNKDGKTARKRK